MTTRTKVRKARRPRIDSPDEVRKIMQSAAVHLTPPAHVPLDDQDLPFWEEILSEQAKALWTDHQLSLAAMLARTMSNMEELQRQLRDEGFTSTTDRGTPVPNPLVGVVKGLSNDILALRRSLALHARGKTGDNRSAATARNLSRETEDKAKPDEEEDDLIARPK